MEPDQLPGKLSHANLPHVYENCKQLLKKLGQAGRLLAWAS